MSLLGEGSGKLEVEMCVPTGVCLPLFAPVGPWAHISKCQVHIAWPPRHQRFYPLHAEVIHSQYNTWNPPQRLGFLG